MSNLGGYQTLTTLAKQAGGPEKLMVIIKRFARQQGVREGIRIGRKNKNIWVAGAFGAGALLTIAFQRAPDIVERCRSKFNKEEITRADAESAEELLVDLLNNDAIDTLQSPSDSSVIIGEKGCD